MTDEDRSGDTTSNAVSGDVTAVVQTGHVQGDVQITLNSDPALPRPRQLPLDIPNFVDRHEIIRALDALLDSAWTAGREKIRPAIVISALAGAAGIGKTALAVHWAHRVRARFPDGHLYVNLRGYDGGPRLTSAQALIGFLRAFDVPAAQIPTDVELLAALYRSTLSGKRVLVVLDNAASADQVRPLLPAAAECAVVITSRSTLSGLAVREGVRRMVLDVLSAEQSMHLLQQILGSARVDAEPDAARQLVSHASRLPLALSIIAERAMISATSTLQDLAEELAAEQNRLDSFAVGDDDLSAVRTVFSWSYKTLSPEAARLFRLLSLHPGPDFDVSSAAALAGLGVSRARRSLEALTSIHMAQEVRHDRYQFHDLLRAYAVECVERDESPSSRRSAFHRLSAWYLHNAAASYRLVLPQGRPLPMDETVVPPAVGSLLVDSYEHALAWCEEERESITSIIAETERIHLDEHCWRLTIAMMAFFERRSHWEDWISTHQTALRAVRRTGDRSAEAWLLVLLADAHWDMRSFDDALENYQSALLVSQQIDDPWGKGFSLHGSALVYQETGRFTEAAEACRAALAIFRRTGERRGEGMTLLSLGNSYVGLNEFDQAVSHYRRALPIFDELDNLWSKALTVHKLGIAHGRAGQNALSVESHRYALGVFRALSDRRHEGKVLIELGETYARAGEEELAKENLRRAVDIFDDIDDVLLDRTRARLDELSPSSEG
jgi:tetratricopeptide (TPR) repeat protein